MRLIIVEDKIPLNNSLQKILQKHHFVVDQAFDGAEALSMIDPDYHDLVILDLTLPKIDGLQVIQELRQHHRRLPILVLTARGTTPEIVNGLRTGADDYLAKPFSISELLARIDALLRRSHTTTPMLSVDNLTLNPATGEVRRAGQLISLSQTEYRLLHYLLHKPNWIVTKSELLTHVWQHDTQVYDRIVDTYICLLRRKIDKAFPHHKPLIHTIKTRGYQLHP
jgi:DNA-binding response OmpR family regulator